MTAEAIDCDCAVMVFARSPEPGACKTRLIPAIGAQGAARLQRWMTCRALETAISARLGAVQLWCAPDAGHEFFSWCGEHYAVSLHHQCGGDLGRRMRHAFDSVLGQHKRALCIGVDAPALTADGLRRADALLVDGFDTVIQPAEDGGYVLIGLARLAPELFGDIAWGTDRVLAQTKACLERRGWRYMLMDTCWDVDRPADLARLAEWTRSRGD